MRIVSLLPSATELLFAVGAGADVVAVTHECDHPAGATRLPAVTRNVLDHDGQPSAAIDRHISSARHQGSSIYALRSDRHPGAVRRLRRGLPRRGQGGAPPPR